MKNFFLLLFVLISACKISCAANFTDESLSENSQSSSQPSEVDGQKCFYYRDQDLDRYGDPLSVLENCFPPSGYVENADDCDDNDAQVFPKLWYLDADGDSYGNPSQTLRSCNPPLKYVQNATDCDDADAAISPKTIWYADKDADGFLGRTISCAKPESFVPQLVFIPEESIDCDDTKNAVYPGAFEYIDHIDQNCDGKIRTLYLKDISPDHVFHGAERGDNTGFDLAAGDFDGDGYDDMLISAVFAGSDLKGKIYLIYGKPSLILDQADATLVGEFSNDHAGQFLSTSGDVNADGCVDFLIGVPEYSDTILQRGKTYLIYGSGARCAFPQRLTGTNSLTSVGAVGGISGATFLGVNREDYSGADIASAGDIDGDGKDDLLIGAYGADATANASGKVYLVYGKALNDVTCMDGTNPHQMNLSILETAADAHCGHEILGEGGGSLFGITLAGVGDVNQNGTDDLFIGAYGFNPDPNQTQPAYQYQGKAYLFDFGILGTPAGQNIPRRIFASTDTKAYFGGFALTGLDDWRSCASTISALGDTDGDSANDFMLGCYALDNRTIQMPDSGGLYVMYGGEYTGDIASDALFLLGTEDNGQLAQENLASGGNVNRDAFADILIGASRVNGGTWPGKYEAGKTYLILGRSRVDFAAAYTNQFLDNVDLTFREVGGFEFLGEERYDESGAGLASGDFDGDGDTDILIGAPGDEVNKLYKHQNFESQANPPRPGKVYFVESRYE